MLQTIVFILEAAVLITHHLNYDPIRSKLVGGDSFVWTAGQIEGVGVHFLALAEVLTDGEWRSKLLYASNPHQVAQLRAQSGIRLVQAYLLSHPHVNGQNLLRLDPLHEVWEVDISLLCGQKRQLSPSFKFVIESGSSYWFGEEGAGGEPAARIF